MLTSPSSVLFPVSWVLLAVLLRAANQILMKLFALNWDDSAIDVEMVTMAGSIGLILVARAFCWQRALSELPLSVAYSFFSLTLITLMASGYLIFGEKITIMNLTGAGLICFGIYIIATSYNEGETR